MVEVHETYNQDGVLVMQRIEKAGKTIGYIYPSFEGCTIRLMPIQSPMEYTDLLHIVDVAGASLCKHQRIGEYVYNLNLPPLFNGELTSEKTHEKDQ